VLLIGSAFSSNINYVNHCGWSVGVFVTHGTSTNHNVDTFTLGAGASSNKGYASGDIFNVKVRQTGSVALAEFSINSWNNFDFYDLSAITGFDGTKYTLVAPDGTNLVCASATCPDAYLYSSDDSKTHSVGTGGTYTLYFC